MIKQKWNVVIADDYVMVCQSVAAILRTLPFIDKVYTAHNGRETLDVVERHPVDLALLDVRMPVMNGIQAAKHILADHRSVKVLAMTLYSEAPTIIELLQTGVHGILLKADSGLESIELAITTVMNGGHYHLKK
jgi:DNA-binding NarL/FixJ family response regulator